MPSQNRIRALARRAAQNKKPHRGQRKSENQSLKFFERNRRSFRSEARQLHAQPA